MKKKVFLLVMSILLVLIPAFAIDTMTASFNINFTAGLIANMGFSSSAISNMVYPSDAILKNNVVFDFNEAKGNIETDSFYVFCQIFNPNTKVSISGSALTSDSDSLTWTNTASGFTFSSSSENVILLETGTSPDYACYELNLKIDKITENTNWQANYEGSLTLTISAGN